VRAAHARNSQEWIRRMEVPEDRDTHRPRWKGVHVDGLVRRPRRSV